MTNEPVVVSDVAGQWLAVPLSSVREVVRPGRLVAIPRAPFGCLGALDLRGDLVPVVWLATLVGLGLPPRGPARTRALLTGHLVLAMAAGGVVGLLVDRVVELHEEGLDAPEPVVTLSPRATALVRGSVRVGARTAWLLDPEGVVHPVRRRLLSRAVAGGLA